MPTTEGQITTDFLDAFASAWNRHDIDAILSAMTEDAVMLNSAGPAPWGRRSVGRDEIRRSILDLLEIFPDAQWTEPKHFVAGQRGVTEWVFKATAPDGAKLETHGCDLFVFRDGRIAVKDSYRKQPVR